MAPSVAPMQLLVSIVERGKGRELREHYRQFGLIHHNQAAGHGTAASHLLDALGFGTSERDIILTLGPKDTMLQLVYHLKDEDRSKLGTPGIAFTLNLSGMSAILAVALSRLEEMKPERGEQFMEQGNHHSLILATVNTGYTDEVMETARTAGARGGTVIRARWTDAEEVLAIVATNRERNAILEAINAKHGLRTAAQAMVISLPIDHTARLD